MTNYRTWMFIMGFTVQVSAMPFDQTSVLPVLVTEAKTVQTAQADCSAANRIAEKAANSLASGFNDIPKDQRDAAKAKALCQLEDSLGTMSEKMEIIHRSMARIQAVMETGLAGGLGAMREKIDGMLTEFSGQLVQQKRTSDALLKWSDTFPDGVGEKEAQNLNNSLDAVAQRTRILNKMRERRDRMGAINETILQKIEGVKALLDAIEVRITELKAEAFMVDVLKKEHQITIVTDGMFGVGTAGDPAKILDNTTSSAMDQVMDRKPQSGTSQREILRLRREAK